jgi:pantoate--beta-alanine ligase
MHVTHTIQETRQYLKNRQGKIGYVPTMGYLHDGHRSLLARARKECDTVVLSIFVNPLQFGPNEDLDRYPRDMESDLNMAADEGVDLVFCPTREVMYPQKTLTKVSVSSVTELLCGASRPGHFDGVATVVTKLLNIVQPHRAYFGQKDAQQVAVITQMVNDMNIPVEMVPCETIRESDGLAMSSRNVYLNPDERKQAVILYETLQQAKRWMDEGLSDVSELKQKMVSHIQTRPLADIDYVELLKFPQLSPIDLVGRDTVVLALAVRFGKTRLIDNLLVSREGPHHV